jgi:FkbM family methyltransferase
VPMISYAQNGEDVVLARAFAPGHMGFYVDVGASDPVVDSVTKHFYEIGWSGINVEPAALAMAAIEAERPRDVNLDMGVSDASGTATFYELPRQMTGCSTFDKDLAATYEQDGWPVDAREVRILTLAELFAEQVGDRVVDFLKVDVEGHEPAVLGGADFTRFRPRVVIVEATVPGTRLPAHESWEPGLLASGYTFTLFDGLNRFYVREEDPELAAILGAPANTFDDYITRQAAQWRDRAADVERQEAEKQSLLRERDDLAVALDRTRDELMRSDAHLRDLQVSLDSARKALGAELAARA